MFDLDVRDLHRLAVLGFGPYNSGKTYLMGDFLAEQKKVGEVAFIDIKGEEGSLSVADFKLGKCGYRVEKLTELKALFAHLKTRNLAGVGLDSLQALIAIINRSLFQSDIYPDEPAKWNEFHSTLRATVAEFKTVAPWVFATCSAAMETDPMHQELTGQPIKFVAPDLPGKQARFIIGCFDMAGYLSVKRKGNKTTRHFVLDAPDKLLVRQRLPRPITERIVLPEGPGGWLAIRSKIEAALEGSPPTSPETEAAPKRDAVIEGAKAYLKGKGPN
jgi:hypothetical protein